MSLKSAFFSCKLSTIWLNRRKCTSEENNFLSVLQLLIKTLTVLLGRMSRLRCPQPVHVYCQCWGYVWPAERSSTTSSFISTVKHDVIADWDCHLVLSHGAQRTETRPPLAYMPNIGTTVCSFYLCWPAAYHYHTRCVRNTRCRRNICVCSLNVINHYVVFLN